MAICVLVKAWIKWLQWPVVSGGKKNWKFRWVNTIWKWVYILRQIFFNRSSNYKTKFLYKKKKSEFSSNFQLVNFYTRQVHLFQQELFFKNQSQDDLSSYDKEAGATRPTIACLYNNSLVVVIVRFWMFGFRFVGCFAGYQWMFSASGRFASRIIVEVLEM